MPKKAELVVEDRKIQVSNLDKVLYPKVGFTKGQVIDYYIRIAQFSCRIKDRPLTMKRYRTAWKANFFTKKIVRRIGRSGCRRRKFGAKAISESCNIASPTICRHSSGPQTWRTSSCTRRSSRKKGSHARP